ncbi:helix-turn-helix domain-containing protein [Streptomyces lunalinharesii]|uniref:Transcriptional regulator n=1 Tax=Streptomyces lunalinharesii TaxID=333384 RepID=A0ABP6F3E3_9ACTN
MPTALVPIELPEWAWQRPEVCEALRTRDVGAVFRHVQQYGGVSQGRIATAVAMTQARVNEVINGRREITRLDVFERIAEGLNMPGRARHLLGLSSRRGDHLLDPTTFPEVVAVYATQAAAAEEIRQLAVSAQQVDILAVRGLGLIGLNDSLLRSPLSRPDGQHAPRVRVLLLDPDSPALSVRAAEIGESTESLAGGVRLAESRLRELSSVCDLHVYQYRTHPTWRIIRLDRTMFVSAFDTDWEGHESATYRITETANGLLYRGFQRTFASMIETGIRTV